MKLDYKILWIDDQPHNVNAAKRYIESELNSLGFKTEVTWASNVVEYEQKIEEVKSPHDYDLIMVDWDLGKSATHHTYTGDQLAKEFRRFTYTEMVFYSAKPVRDLRRLIFDQGIDGVYSVNRNQLGESTLEIIHANIKKVLDINNMRGIIVSSVGDFDHIMADCLHINHESSNSEQKHIQIESIKNRVRESLEYSLEKISKMDTLMELLTNYSFSTYIRMCELQSQIRPLDKQSFGENSKILNAFKSEIIDMRNMIAHARIIDEDGIKKFEARPHNLPASEDYFRTARTTVIKHEENLMSIRQKLIDQRSTDDE